MGHGVPHKLGTEGMKSCLRRRRTVSSSKVEGIVTAELRARKLQPDRPIHYPTDSLLSWNNQVGPEQRVAYRLGKLSNAEISGFSASRRVSRVEPPISSTFDKLGEGSAGEGTLARW